MIDEDRQLAELLDTLPAVRWPDPVSPLDEMVSAVVCASPVAARQYLEVVGLVLDRAGSLDDAVRGFYEAGAYLGAHGGSEAAGMLWALADTVRVEP